MRLFIPLALIVLTLEFVGCKNEGGSSSVTGDVKIDDSPNGGGGPTVPIGGGIVEITPGDFDGFNGEVSNIEQLDDGSIIVLGSFTKAGALPAPGIAKMNSSGVVDQEFSAKIGSGANGGDVFTVLETEEDNLLILGDFNSFNGNPVSNAASVSLDPYSEALSAPKFNGPVYGIFTTSKMETIIFGNFDKLNDESQFALVAVDSSFSSIDWEERLSESEKDFLDEIINSKDEDLNADGSDSSDIDIVTDGEKTCEDWFLHAKKLREDLVQAQNLLIEKRKSFSELRRNWLARISQSRVEEAQRDLWLQWNKQREELRKEILAFRDNVKQIRIDTKMYKENLNANVCKKNVHKKWKNLKKDQESLAENGES